MATFFRDFSAEATSSPVTNVSTPWAVPDTYDIVDAGDENMLRIYSVGLNNAVGLSTFSSGLDDNEICACWRTSSISGADVGVVLGLGGSVSSRYAILFRFAAGNLYIRRYNGGSPVTIGATVAFSATANTLYWMRLRYEDGVAYGKIWDASGSEPPTWNIERTCDSVPDGLPGILLPSSYVDAYWGAVGFADAGETAPLELSAAPTVSFSDNAPEYNIVDGETFSFVDATSGGTTPYTYSWEYSTDSGSNWTEFSTSSSATYTPDSAGPLQIRLTITDAADETVVSEVSSYTIGDSSHTYIRRPEDHGQIDVAGSVITGADGTTPAIALVPGTTLLSSIEYSRYFNCVVYNCSGKTPTFTVDWSTYDGGGLGAFGYSQPESVVSLGYSVVWTTNPLDASSWQTFPTVSGDNTAKTITASGVEFSSSEDTVYVAFQPLMTYALDKANVEALSTNPYVSVPDSVIDHDAAPFVFATLPALSGYGIPSLDQRCFAIGSGPVVVAITNGQHSNEDTGCHTFWAFVDYLLSDAEDAVSIREHFTIYCYTMVNPQGFYGGIFRNAPGTNGIVDPNRSWDRTTCQAVNNVKAAIATDCGAPQIYGDFHGYSGSGTGLYINESDNVNGTFDACNDDFAAAMSSLVSLNFVEGVDDTPNLSISRDYYQVSIGSELSFNVETGVWHNSITYNAPFGVAAARSLEATYLAGNLSMRPTISATTEAIDAHSVAATVTTSNAGGTIYGVLSESATAPEDSEIVASPTDTADVTDAGDYGLGADELDARTTYYWHIVHVDGDDLASDVLTVAVTTRDVSIALEFDDAAPCSLMAFLATSNLTMSDAELKALLDGE